MQIFAHEIDVVLQDSLSSLKFSGGFRERPYHPHDLLKLVRLVQVGHFTRIKNVVDVFQERFDNDLCVIKKEDRGEIF